MRRAFVAEREGRAPFARSTVPPEGVHLPAPRLPFLWREGEGGTVGPTEWDMARWRARGLVAGPSRCALAEGVRVTFQELLPQEGGTRNDGETWWEAWWYCPRSRTGGSLASVEPIRGGLFGFLVKREVLRVQRMGGSIPPPARRETSVDATTNTQAVASDELPNVDASAASPAPPVEDWTNVTTTPADHVARKERVRRAVTCRYCGNLSGTSRRVCQRPTCQRKAARE